MKTIVVAVDFSNATPGVLEMASGLAKAFGAQLRLFHVVEPEPSYTAYGFTPDEFPALHAYQEEAKRRAATKLEELLAKVKPDLPDATSPDRRRQSAPRPARLRQGKRRGFRGSRLARPRRDRLPAARQRGGGHGAQGHGAHADCSGYEPE